jgi:hypothetical protein
MQYELRLMIHDDADIPQQDSAVMQAAEPVGHGLE